MLDKSTISRTIAVLLLSAAAGAAQAGNGFYVGGGAGQSFVDDGAYDDEDTAFSLFGGYQFNRYFAIEGGYADLGEIKPSTGVALKADTFHLTAVGTLPVSDAFSLYAKAGAHRWSTDRKLSTLGGDDAGTDLTYGIGAQYRFNKRFAVRAEVSRFELSNTNVDVTQLQLRYDF